VLTVLIGALFGTAEAFFRPACTGLVPQTVDEDDIQPAQALSGVSQEVAEIVGPALATALVLGVGGAAAFAVDAALRQGSGLRAQQRRVGRRHRHRCGPRLPVEAAAADACRSPRLRPVADGSGAVRAGAARGGGLPGHGGEWRGYERPPAAEGVVTAAVVSTAP